MYPPAQQTHGWLSKHADNHRTLKTNEAETGAPGDNALLFHFNCPMGWADRQVSIYIQVVTRPANQWQQAERAGCQQA